MKGLPSLWLKRRCLKASEDSSLALPMINPSPGVAPRPFALGAELALIYLHDKAKKFVEPLARELEAKILLPLDVRTPGQMEAVFERISRDWGSA